MGSGSKVYLGVVVEEEIFVPNRKGESDSGSSSLLQQFTLDKTHSGSPVS